MNNATLPLIATITLSAIAGITGTHFHQVSQMVKNGVTPAPIILTAPDSESPSVQPRADIIASIPSPKLPVMEKKMTMPAFKPSEAVARTPREDALLKILAEQTQMLSAMRTEQKHLRKQLSETNRDMDELTFRVDSHSSDFRPLRVDNTRPRGLITVPDTVPDADTNNGGVLPAKQ